MYSILRCYHGLEPMRSRSYRRLEPHKRVVSSTCSNLRWKLWPQCDQYKRHPKGVEIQRIPKNGSANYEVFPISVWWSRVVKCTKNSQKAYLMHHLDSTPRHHIPKSTVGTPCGLQIYRFKVKHWSQYFSDESLTRRIFNFYSRHEICRRSKSEDRFKNLIARTLCWFINSVSSGHVLYLDYVLC